jgi:hypothetical protein
VRPVAFRGVEDLYDIPVLRKNEDPKGPGSGRNRRGRHKHHDERDHPDDAATPCHTSLPGAHQEGLHRNR